MLHYFLNHPKIFCLYAHYYLNTHFTVPTSSSPHTSNVKLNMDQLNRMPYVIFLKISRTYLLLGSRKHFQMHSCHKKKKEKEKEAFFNHILTRWRDNLEPSLPHTIRVPHSYSQHNIWMFVCKKLILRYSYILSL